MTDPSNRAKGRARLLNLRHGVSEGACIWLTGLSGSGKTSTAVATLALLQAGELPVGILDGDALRLNHCADLGFSPADRNKNIARIASIARDLVTRGQIVICATISPYRHARAEARRIVGASRFIEVFVDSPLEVCEARDPKGLYARARSGELTGFTGIDAPYEAPLEPDLVIDSATCSLDENALRIVDCLESHYAGKIQIPARRSA